MRRSGRLLLALSLMSVPATAGAQELLPSCPNKQNITADDKTNALNLERAGNDTVTPTGRTASLLKGLAGEMEVNNGEARTSISYGDKLAPRICPADADGAVRFRQTSYGFTLSVPLANDTDLIDPQLLDGLSDGPSLSFNLSRYSATSRDAPKGFQSTAWQFGGEVSIGMNQFHYRDPVSLAKHSDWKPQLGIGGFLAFYPKDRRSMVSFGIDYQSSYEAAEEQILCKPMVTDPDKDCAKAAPKGPDREDSLNLSIEYRRAPKLKIAGANIGYSPKFTYDSLNDDFGAELPFYFLPSEKSPLLPGFKIGYASDKDDVILGVFLKASFGMMH
ncbi:hypothetical protein DAH51_12830 [Sphingobium yanoikuyae]|jgi:hypothetical protein|uniref:Transporter n=1 Tax=Sphingobium yanoikuyae TaxID=13690 RepID=A0A430BV87_SPHYA|nr:hypothetical protein DAH51_12830 [Sphingobium yanoikuyae]